MLGMLSGERFDVPGSVGDCRLLADIALTDHGAIGELREPDPTNARMVSGGHERKDATWP